MMTQQTFKEIFSEALPVLQKFAPTIAGAIGGPLGMASGFVISLLSNVFGAHPGNFAELASNLINDPEVEEKLKNIETEHGHWISGLMESVNNLAKAEVNVKLEWQPLNPRVA